MLWHRVGNIGLRGAVLVSRLALIVLLAQFLVPADLGLYGLFVVTVTYAVLAVGLDFYTYSQRELITGPRTRSGFVLRHHALVTGCAYFVVLPVSAYVFIAGHLPFWVFPWFVALLVTEHVGQEINRFLVAMHRQVSASLVLFIRQGVWVWVLLGLMWFYPDLRRLSLVFGCWLVASICAVILGSVFLSSRISREPMPSWDWSWIRRGLYTGMVFLIATLCLRGVLTFDRYIMESFTDLEMVGVYTLYAGIALAIMGFMDAAVFVFRFPRLVEAYGHGQASRFRTEWRRLSRDTVVLLCLLVAMAAFVGWIVVGSLQSPLYLDNIDIFWWLLGGICLQTLSMVPHYGLYAMRGDRLILAAHVSCLIAFLLLAVFLSVHWPRLGVPMALTGAFAWLAAFKVGAYWLVRGSKNDWRMDPIRSGAE